MLTPNSSLRRVFGQAPPTDLRSTAATRCPRPAKVRRAVSSRGRCEVREDRRLPAVLENPFVLFSIVRDALECARHSLSSGDRTLTGCSFEICPSFAAAECHRLPVSYHCIPNTKKERLASRPAIELSSFLSCRTSSQDRANLNRQLTNLRRMPNPDGNWSQPLSNHLVSRYADRRMHCYSAVYSKTAGASHSHLHGLQRRFEDWHDVILSSCQHLLYMPRSKKQSGFTLSAKCLSACTKNVCKPRTCPRDGWGKTLLSPETRTSWPLRSDS